MKTPGQVNDGPRYGIPLEKSQGAVTPCAAWFASLDDAIQYAQPRGLEVWDLIEARCIREAGEPRDALGEGMLELGRATYRHGYKEGFQDAKDPEGHRDPDEVWAEIDADSIRDGWDNIRSDFARRMANP